MAVTPQTNVSIAGIAEVLRHADDIVVCGHQSPDGDCVGSTLALVHGLRALGKRAHGLAVDAVPPNLRFLPGADALASPESFTGVCACFVAVDVPNLVRMKGAAALHEAADATVRIDHHAHPERVSAYSYTDPDAASCSVLVWEVLGALGAQTAEAATCCYAGLVTDTGRFSYQNADAHAFAAAAEMIAAGANPAAVCNALFEHACIQELQLEARALEYLVVDARGFGITYLSRTDFAEFGATAADAEGVVDHLRRIGAVDVLCCLREQDGVVRASFRAKNSVDVAAVARSFGGGGHVAAAGATLTCSLPEALTQVRAALEEACDARN